MSNPVTRAAAVVLRKVATGAPGRPAAEGHDDPRRWRKVTVLAPRAELERDLPGPLADLGDAIEVQLQEAPGDKGTEVGARLRPGGGLSGTEGLQTLRQALREAKQLVEVGYVLQPDANTTSQPTPLNAPLREATRNAGGEGRL